MIEIEYRAVPLRCCGCGLPSNRAAVYNDETGLCELCERKYCTPFSWGVWQHPYRAPDAPDADVLPFRTESSGRRVRRHRRRPSLLVSYKSGGKAC